MAGEMFGAPAGISAAIGDLGTLAQTQNIQAGIQLKQGQLAAQPQMLQAEILGALSKARLDTAKAGISEEDLRQKKLFSEGLAKMGVDTGTGTDDTSKSQSRYVFKMADVARKIGAADQYLELLKQGTIISGHENTAKKEALEAKRLERQLEADGIDWFEKKVRLLGDDDSQGKAALDAEFRKKYNAPSPLEGINLPTWKLKEIALDQTLKAKEKIAIADRQEKEEHLKSFRDSTIELKRLMAELAKERVDLAKARAEQGAKQGVVPPASKADKDEIFRLIKKDYPKLDSVKDNADVEAFATSVADQTKRFVRNNPAWEWEKAREKIYEARKDELKISSLTKFRDVPKELGKSKDFPLPMVADPEKRDVGKFYEQGKKTYQWVEEGRQRGWKEVN